MIIDECKHNTKCDFYGCSRIAEFSIRKTNNLKSNQMHFCKDCLTKLYREIGEKLIPKPIKSPFIKGVKNAKNK